MAYKTFAAIDVGSYELAMKIYEISNKNGIKEIDHIRHRIELGTDSYLTGKIRNDRVDELCRMLCEFTDIMESYKVDGYKAYGTSAIRETQNSLILLDQIQTRTGIKIEVLSNSEQRFLDYKSVASRVEDFQSIIEKSTAFIDIGGGSVQISLFDEDSLVTSQNIRPGVLRMREELTRVSYRSYQLEDIVEEMVCDSLESFREMFVGDKKIQNIILVDDYVSLIVQRNYLETRKKGQVDARTFLEFVDSMKKKKAIEIALSMGLAEENISLLHLSALMIKYMIKALGAEMLWAPGVSLCDGMAYEYAEQNKLLPSNPDGAFHNFEQDILDCARDINRRYHSIEHRTREREMIALTIFDNMKKNHGLSKRDRLLLQLAAILSECGRYISLANVGESSYNIIMATEIIGLSHLEREIVANIVKYSTENFEYYEILGRVTTLDRESYLRIAKLTAIIRLSEGLDLSHKGKCDKLKIVNDNDEMVLMVESNADMTLEFGLFDKHATFFEEVFNIKPVIRQKKSNI
ncbi:MAG: exopolyphosphatase [Lachnospiraceae bacterium]|nr:exopolyphosphatase [Lachnospiraceae bacterium]MBO5144496.1 exopolyphosphatase [Lachnospiraceae bacterium]